MALERQSAQTQGYVLDPILSLSTSLSLGPHERAQVSLIVAAGESRQQVLLLMDKYGDPQVVERAMDLAWASAQLELRVLRIQPDDARRYQKLGGQLLYPSAAFRPGAERFEERNRKGQAGLWAYGISGDLPIVLVTIGEVRDVQLVRQILQAHTYWRAHGLMADLLILNDESSSYEQPLRERLESLIRLHTMYTGVDKPGGVFLRSADQIPEEDVRLLMAASSAILVAARGTLPQQLGVAIEAPDVARSLTAKPGPRDASAPLPFLDLPYFNSLGGFTGDGREYAIYLGPGTNTPAPWVNVIANPTFGTVVSETGAGFTWYGNSQRNRLTPWSNDPVLDPPSEAIYLRDEETGEFWTPTASPIRESTAYRARHGAGYTVFEHNSHGIEQELTVLVPVDDQGGQPLKLQRLRIRNDSGRPRRLSITSYAEWALGETREAAQMHTVSQWDEEAEALVARNRFHPDYPGRIAFAAMSRPVDSFSADRTTFLGRNRSLANPAAMERVASSKRTGAGMDPCAALRTSLDLAPDETAQVIILLGQAESSQEVKQLVLSHRDPVTFELTLDSTRAWWDNVLGTIEVHTPELSLDFLVNRWLLYQTLSCRVWARSAFYQSGGAYGFRDQLQDVLGLVYARPEIARQHILLAASRQFREGDVQHWWHAPSGTGIRSRISDDLLWLPYAVAHYVRQTGDEDILQAPVPFLEGPRPADGQRDLFGTPEVSSERASLFEHCQRAVQHGLTSGPSGLPLIGTGDWNDGMDRVGAEGKGESIWLGWFLVAVLEGMAELAEIVGSPESAESYRKRRAELLQRIDGAAWDGSWYLRASFDDGTPVGSAANREARIDLLPQAWASISGGGDPERAAQSLEAADEHLVRREENLVLLFDPPFDKHTPSPGYIQGYPPGIRENGGQYTHAAVWLAIAHARRGQGGRAGEILRVLNPIEHARDIEGAWRYTVEPYVMAADVYRAPGRTGQGGWSWYTGAAAWMYRAWVEELLGLKLRGESLRMDPVIPNGWPGFELTYRHGEAVYEIHVDNAAGVERGVVAVEMDGRPIPEGVIPLERLLVKHRVNVRMGASEAR
jgi:cyclic beta-1,2-glucan synthetase